MTEQFSTSRSAAEAYDRADPLATFKGQFHFPQHKGNDAIYFCGNSLGLQPKRTSNAIHVELDSWKELAVGGYFGGKNPWLYYSDYCAPALAKIMGCGADELTVMNTLTVNLHLMLLSFYKPSKQRYKIIMEAGAFPSDQYAIETQVQHYLPYVEDLNLQDAIIEISPRSGEKLLRTEDIVACIHEHADALSLVMFGGMNYYTGQFFDMEAITEAAHSVGAFAGFDLAHVAGNIPTRLHDWNVDFAVWCSYKYLNAGPGAVGGVFVREKHAKNQSINRMAGWWGNDEKTRFKMEKSFEPKPNASGWNISTAQVFNMVGLKASLEMFEVAGMENIRTKSLLLTSYLEYLLKQLPGLNCEIITPAEPSQRGAQLSLYFSEQGKAIHDKMIELGIIVDYREPGVIRVAPAPLYCSFSDVYRFYEILKSNFTA